MHTDTNKLIFIVDDNEMYSLMLDYILSKESTCHFERYKSGEACLKNLYQKPVIVILDYTLPGMNGYDILLEIKRQNPAIHVVILTGNKDKKLAEELIRAGADDCILKQGHGERQVMEKIDEILNKRELENDRLFWQKQPPLGNFMYLILLLLLMALGIFYYT